MDLSQIYTGMPWIWYFIPLNAMSLVATIGMTVLVVAVAACWYQIMNEPSHH